MCDENGNRLLQYPQICTRPVPHVCTINGPCNGYPKADAAREAQVYAESASVHEEVVKGAEELGNYQNWCHENIHVYQVDEGTFIAATGPEEAVLHYQQMMGALLDETLLDEFGAPVLFTEAMLLTQMMCDEDGSNARNLRAALDDCFYQGLDFPLVLATEQ